MIARARGEQRAAPLTLRPAGPADLREVCRLNALLAAELGHDALAPDELEDGVRALLADPALGRCWLAATPDGRAAGQLVLKTLFDEWSGRHHGWIDNVVVGRSHRRRGVATALVELAARRARQDGLPLLRLYVAEDNAPALAAYLAAGFAVKGKLLERPL